MARTTKPPAVAYSYLRFSSPEQAKGDSTRRQTVLRDDWLQRHPEARLDTSLRMADKGVSGFTGAHRSNPDRHALAAFLELVKQGRVAKGSYLIVENLDRLSREHIQPALILFLNLLQAGVRVVQLTPAEQVFDDRSDSMQIMMAIMELSRGNSESAMKSVRLGAAWREKKRRAAAGEPLTRAVPGWLRVQGGKFVVVERSADVIRRIYRMATEGHGLGVITKRLNAEGVPPIGRARHWGRSYVAKLLGTRAVVGEYQPHKGHAGPDRKPDGPPIPNYFPAILTEREWYAARAALSNRRTKAGRIGRRVNLFTGLLRDAQDGGTLQVLDKGAKSAGPVLVNYRAYQGVREVKYVSFPLATFEDALLSKLFREIDPREVLPQRNGAADRVSALQGEVDEVRRRIARLKAALGRDDDIKAVVEQLREWEGREAELTAELSRALQEAATPLDEAWSEFKSLAEALAKAGNSPEARTRLRAALRRIVSAIWCLFVARGQDRVAVVQFWFEGGAHRDYLILHEAGHGNASAKRLARWSARSFARPVKAGDLDLRDPKQAAALAADLEADDQPESNESAPKTARRRAGR